MIDHTSVWLRIILFIPSHTTDSVSRLLLYMTPDLKSFLIHGIQGFSSALLEKQTSTMDWKILYTFVSISYWMGTKLSLVSYFCSPSESIQWACKVNQLNLQLKVMGLNNNSLTVT